MIHVQGRGWRGGTVRVTPYADGVHLRIDDEWNPELWLELTIDHDTSVSLGNTVVLLKTSGMPSGATLAYRFGLPCETPISLPEKETLVRKAVVLILRFRRAWIFHARSGACDAVDGAEFTRVLDEWSQAGHPPEISEFIIRRANAKPDGSDGEVVIPRSTIA